MSKLITPPAHYDPTAIPDEDAAVQRKVDRWLIIGAFLCSTMFLGPLGLPLVIWGLVLTKGAIAKGHALRPVAFTVVGLTALTDSTLNYFGWMADLMMHDTVLGSTLLTGWGRIVDSAYYLSYNTTSLGGVSLTSEKSWEIASLLTLYPMRMVAAWGFLKMKRWGFQFMVVTSYMYVFLWIGYTVQMAIDFPFRFGYSMFGLLGWWAIDLPYATSFLVIPYLHVVNRELWTD